MKNLILAAALFVSGSAFALSPSQGHTYLCQEALNSYPGVFDSVETCKSQTSVEYNSDSYNFFEISFASCRTGEYVTLGLNADVMEFSGGSSGLDSDYCK